jgi:hypothetical protein|tara:strand:- start:659 stop:1066 length:408 start_codon:yes stop_codon:yes gene_type:complete
VRKLDFCTHPDQTAAAGAVVRRVASHVLNGLKADIRDIFATFSKADQTAVAVIWSQVILGDEREPRTQKSQLSFDLYFVYVIACLVLLVTPVPNGLHCINHSVRFGPRKTFWTSGRCFPHDHHLNGGSRGNSARI